MVVHHSYLIYKLLNRHYIYFFYLHYKLENLINIFAFKKTLYLLTCLVKFSSFFKPTIFLELSSFDYNNVNEHILLSFTLLYCFLLLNSSLKLFLSSSGSEDEFIYSSSTVFNNLSWSEREIGEMHNINFFEKIDSRHLLLDYSLNGNPMLKTYSLVGYVEILYNFILSIIQYLATLESKKTNNVFDY